MKKTTLNLTVMIILMTLLNGCIGGMTIPDTDKDGINDLQEQDQGTDPNNPDTDGDGLNDGKEKEHGTDPLDPDTDGDGDNDGKEVNQGSNPLGEGWVSGSLQPYGVNAYTAGPTITWNDEKTGTGHFSWTFSDQNGNKPLSNKVACITPEKLPSKYREKYDSGEVIDREVIDKKGENMYIRFNDQGEINLEIKTYNIPGNYTFKICGIHWKEDYKLYEGGYTNSPTNTITLEIIPKPKTIIITDKKCIPLTTSEYHTAYGCYWQLEYADGSNYTCGHFTPAQAYKEMNTSEGTTEHALYELVKQEGTEEKHTYILYSSKSGNTIHRGDTWTLCETGQPCGCCRNHNFKDYAPGIQGLCIKLSVRTGESKTVKIGAMNQNYFNYEGDGDPLTVTH